MASHGGLPSSSSLPALPTRHVQQDAKSSKVAPDGGGNVRFELPMLLEGQHQRLPAVKPRRKKVKGRVSRATVDHALHRITAEEAALVARLAELGAVNAAAAAAAATPAEASVAPSDSSPIVSGVGTNVAAAEAVADASQGAAAPPETDDTRGRLTRHAYAGFGGGEWASSPPKAVKPPIPQAPPVSCAPVWRALVRPESFAGAELALAAARARRQALLEEAKREAFDKAALDAAKARRVALLQTPVERLPPIPKPPPRTVSLPSLGMQKLRARYSVRPHQESLARHSMAGGGRAAGRGRAPAAKMPSIPPAQAPTVSAETVAAAMGELRAALLSNLQRVIDGFRALDANGDGTVSKREFCHAVGALPALARYPTAALAQLFDALDADGSGVIEISEIKSLLRRKDITLAAELQVGAQGEIVLHAKNAIAIRVAPTPEEEAAAATTVQACVRGRRGRARAAAASATSAPSVASASQASAPDDPSKAAQEHAALLAAVEAFSRTRAVGAMQRVARVWLLRYRTARKLQTGIRGRIARNGRRREQKARKAAATTLQGAYRGRRTRAHLATTKASEARAQETAAMQLQARMRGHTSRGSAKRQAREREAAAVRMQASVRGHRVRRPPAAGVASSPSAAAPEPVEVS